MRDVARVCVFTLHRITDERTREHDLSWASFRAFLRDVRQGPGEVVTQLDPPAAGPRAVLTFDDAKPFPSQLQERYGTWQKLIVPKLPLMKALSTKISSELPKYEASFRKAFPDPNFWGTADLIAEGDKVVGLVTARGTHQGEFMGIAPTGKPVSFNAIDVVRIAGGKIVERWSQADNLALLQQLGAVPAPGQTAPTR